MVDKFVALSHIEHIVNPHDFAPPFVLADDHLLELSFLSLDDLCDRGNMLIQVIIQFVSSVSGVTLWHLHLNCLLDNPSASFVTTSNSDGGLNATI